MKLFVQKRTNAFTLVEALAALAFMAIVIPVAVEGLRLASAVGQLGQRRIVAGQVAERVLNETILSTEGQAMPQSGRVYDGAHEYRWSVQWQTWPEDSMNQLTVLVIFQLQGREYDVQLTTLIDSSS